MPADSLQKQIGAPGNRLQADQEIGLPAAGK